LPWKIPVSMRATGIEVGARPIGLTALTTVVSTPSGSWTMTVSVVGSTPSPPRVNVDCHVQ
jgi:hypothetical protein